MRLLRAVFIVGLLVATVPVLTFGQGQTGTVSGVVTDATDAVIPGAQVRLVNTETGIARETSANEQGYFYFDKVQPGIYTVSITSDGFKKHEITGLDVRVAKNTDVGRSKLEVGSVDSVVQVESSTAPLMETQSAQITSSLSAKQTVALRQGFGGLDGLALLTPGVVPGMGNINSNGMQVAANGQRSRSTQFMLDGHQMNDITIGGPSLFVQNLDGIAEYQVVTNQFSAEYGRNLGATVNIISKAGTNDFHGSLTWLHRNDNLNSRSSLQSRNDLNKPELKDNRWFANVGGPVIRDRLFFQFGYEGQEIPGAVSSIGTSSSLAISPAGLTTLAGAFPASTTLQIYQNSGPWALPEGNPTCVTSTITTRTIAGVPGVELCAVNRTIPSATSQRGYSGKVDFVTSRHTITGRYLWSNNQFCCSGGQNGYLIDIPSSAQSLGITYTFQITPKLLNNFKFSWARFGVSFEGGNTSPISQVNDNLTNISMPSGYLSLGLATNLPQNRFLDTFQYSNTLSYPAGRHWVKFGAEFHRNLTTLFFLPFINGSFSFTSADLTDFINNTPATLSFTAGNGSFDPTEFDQFYFFQDDWKVRPNLTLNLGVRYEHNGQPINKAVDEILNRELDPTTAFWLQTIPIGDRTMRRIPNDNDNVAPRIGFAWTPQMNNFFTGDSQTTIRGGYGISYELAFYNILLNMTTAAPRVFFFSLSGASTIPIPGGGTGNEVVAAIPVPRNTFDPRTFAQTQLSENFHNPYGQNWSLGIQREIGRNMVTEVRYVGTNGIGLFQSRNANPLFSNQFTNFPSTVAPGFTPCPAPPPPPVTMPPTPPTPNPTGLGRPNCDFGQVRERLNSGISNYHSLQVRYDVRNLKNQFTGGLAYTWSKGIDNVSEIFGFFADGSIAFAENPFNIIGAERGRSNQNLDQTLTFHYLWESPWFRSQSTWVGRILGGWSINGTAAFLAGRPWTPIQRTGNTVCGQDSGFNASFAGLLATCRPFASNPSAPITSVGFYDAAGVVHLGSVSGTPVSASDVRFIFNDTNGLNFFSPSNPFGIGRNNFEGDGTVDFNIAIDKRFKISERIGLLYRAAFENAFNHRNFGVPTIRADLADFAIPERNNVSGRSIRMMLKVEF